MYYLQNYWNLNLECRGNNNSFLGQLIIGALKKQVLVPIYIYPYLGFKHWRAHIFSDQWLLQL